VLKPTKVITTTRRFGAKFLRKAWVGYKLSHGPIPGPVQRLHDRIRIRFLEGQLPYWERVYRPSANKPVNVGFIGAGRYAQLHLRVLSALDDVQITGLLTRGGPATATVAQEFSIPGVHTDIDRFLAEVPADCYFVVVSSRNTFEIASKCLATGKPTFIEKPAAYTSAQVLQLAEIAERNHTFGMVGMNRRYFSVLQHGLASLADMGPLRGGHLEVPIMLTTDRQQSRLEQAEYEDMMMRNAIHGIDLLRFVFGEVRDIYSYARENLEHRNAAASYATIIEHESGAVSTLLSLWDTPQIWRMHIVAERGSLELSPLENATLHETGDSSLQVRRDPIDIKYRPGMFAQDTSMINAVRGQKIPPFPASLLSDAAKTTRLVEQVRSHNLTLRSGS